MGDDDVNGRKDVLNKVEYILLNATKRDIIITINKMIKLLNMNNNKDPTADEPDELLEFNKSIASFIEIYPTRTTGGRILSPASADTILGSKLIKKIKFIIKSNKVEPKFLISALKNEIDYRKNTNKMEYMKNIETWLNNGDWENSYKPTKALFTGVPMGRNI